MAAISAHRPDADDSFYLSLPVTCLDRPDEAFLSHDGMFGEPDLPLYRSWYRLKSYEPLLAAVSWWTGLGVKDVYYLWLPALFGALVVLAHWFALRQLGGSYPGLGAAVALAVWLCWGEQHWSPGNFAFVRLFQGKAVLVAVCVPAAVGYGWRFVRRPTPRGWLLLGAVTVASIGISGSAVVAVPTVLAAVLVGGGRRGWRGLPAVAAASVAAVAVFVELGLHRGLGAVLERLDALPALSLEALSIALGDPPRRALAMGALLLAPMLVPRARRRQAVGFAAVLVAVLLSPWLAGFVQQLHYRLGWRLFWTVPFPLLLGLLAQRLAALGGPGRRWTAVAGPALVAGVFLAVGGPTTLSPADGTRLGRPGWKVPPEHAVAATLVALAGPDRRVLAPWRVSAWLPTFRGHPPTVGVRRSYWAPLAARDPGAVAPRLELMRAISQPSRPEASRRFAGLLGRLEVDVVAFAVRRWDRPRLAAVLEGAGFRKRLEQGGYEVWLRRSAAPRVEPVAEAVDHQVEGDHGDHDRQPGEGGQPPGADQPALAFGDQVAPARRRRRDAQPEEGEGGLGEDGVAHQQAGLHQDRGQRVGQQVAAEDLERRQPQPARREHERPLLERQQLGAEQPADGHPAGGAEDPDDRPAAGPEQRDHRHHQEHPGHGDHGVDGAHQHPVGQRAADPRRRSHHHADRQRQQGRQQADGERDPRPVDQPRPQIASEAVGAEQEQPALGRLAGSRRDHLGGGEGHHPPEPLDRHRAVEPLHAVGQQGAAAGQPHHGAVGAGREVAAGHRVELLGGVGRGEQRRGERRRDQQGDQRRADPQRPAAAAAAEGTERRPGTALAPELRPGRARRVRHRAASGRRRRGAGRRRGWPAPPPRR
jgi:hypothetical protein